MPGAVRQVLEWLIADEAASNNEAATRVQASKPAQTIVPP